MSGIPDSAKAIIEKKAFASVATVNEDGSPQVTTVWVDQDGDHVVFNTAKGRLKARNLERDPRISIAIPDPDNVYDQVTVQGRVVEMIEDGADEHINAMAKKYLDEDEYPFRAEGEVRLIVRVEAGKLSTP